MAAHRVIFLLLIVPIVAHAKPAEDPLDALVRDSPFLPAGGAAPAANKESGPLELRGVAFEGREYVFSVYDQASKESKWVKLGQGDLPFTARSYDQEQELLVVEYQGRTTSLKLQTAHVVGQAPSGAASSPPPLPAPGEGSPQAGAPPAPQPGPPGSGPARPTSTGNPEESQRLQRMADEIRRRRSLQQVPPIRK